jgi:myo-inositol 2-dehydrogenase / D-chiro-inositol 1-dehydrogenase
MATAAKTLNVGVIGAGRIGRMHAELLASRVQGAALAAVQDVRPEAASALAEELGVSAPPRSYDLISDP